MILQGKSQNSKTSLNDLYDIAEENEISVMTAECPNCKAISLLSPSGKCYIGMDYKAIKTEREERQYLAHDIGHCVKGAFYNPYSPFSLIEQQEHRADKQAIAYLIPQDEFEKALKQGYSPQELCEYFDVDIKYIRLAFWEYCDIVV